MDTSFENPQAYMARVYSARKGCGMCKGAVRIPPAGNPFSTGPWQGKYLCMECWILYWAEHPDDLADHESYEFVTEEAHSIRRRRESMVSVQGAEILHEDGGSRVLLSARGTLLIEIHPTAGHAPEEYDPERFLSLVRALRAISGKVPGYEASIGA